MEGSPLRPIGYLEKYFIIRNQIKFYNNIEVGATYTVPRSLLKWSAENPLESVIHCALAETLNSQPILGVTIQDEQSPNPKWARLAEFDLREVVKFILEESPSTSVKWIEAGHHEPLDRIGELPLWRVVVALQKPAPTASESSPFSFSMAFFCHHAIADGLSAGAFHLTFLDALNHLIDHPSDILYKPIIEVPKLPLVPNLEMTTHLPVSYFSILKQFIKTYVYNPEDPLEWSGPPISATTPRPPVPNIRTFSLPHTAVNKIALRCREEQTTVTALVTILTARWLGTTYSTHKRFCCKLPFSLRKFSKHTQRDMGCYASDMGLYFSSETKTPRGYVPCYTTSPDTTMRRDVHLWEEARACKTDMDKRGSTVADQNVCFLRFLGDYAKFFLKTFGTKRQWAFEVSNIGVLDGGVTRGEENAERATFDRVTFSTSLFTCGSPYTVFLATAKNGYMTVSIGSETGIVGEEEVVGLLNSLERELMGLGG
ncbi:hypothetical protein L207DRAFT_638391 [Hyaloscypha variabilis F]|uniref:Alcohol acetyltransferase n=1 Tax=Hyaloscypha variabilis (strain UAMH 11265 / GT02V1 / F) TaxID=1149755 RepID=A0A2J6R8R3_HYAVF|nr:hypothetical protein L207DRAFT_638391 [Hyaloscypha variabilis F]